MAHLPYSGDRTRLCDMLREFRYEDYHARMD